MSSAEDRPTIRAITAAEFGEFLNAKGIDPTCPECKTGVAAINTHEGNVGVANFPLGTIDSDGIIRPLDSPSLPGFSVSCQNCGFIRAFTVAKVCKWLEEQQNAGEKENG